MDVREKLVELIRDEMRRSSRDSSREGTEGT